MNKEKIKEFNNDYLRENKPNFIIVFVIIFLLIGLINTTPPNNFSEGKLITIEKGETIKNTAELLKRENIIRSELLFNIVITLTKSNVVEGKYLFHSKENIFKVADRVKRGSYQIPTEKITFVEGETSYQIADKLKKAFPNFDVDTFYELALINEGYLFPDTYEFRLTVSAEEVTKKMIDNFDRQISNISDEIENSSRTLDEIIKMASIIEGEADSYSRQEVADILWKRIDEDMPLQVDATFVYSIGKSTFDLTLNDLRNEDNPYNSYVFRGLPPTPINNPGIKAIRSAARQNDTPYLFFLTGRDGNMYYASTFEAHKNNRRLYLD
jgi:UPF0755 protein